MLRYSNASWTVESDFTIVASKRIWWPLCNPPFLSNLLSRSLTNGKGEARVSTMQAHWSLRSELQPSLALLFCLKGKSCLSLFTLLLKTVLSLALARFWCFLVHSIHSGTFLFQTNCKKEIVLAKSSIPESVWYPSVHMRTKCGSSWDFNQSINQSINHSLKIEKA